MFQSSPVHRWILHTQSRYEYKGPSYRDEKVVRREIAGKRPLAFDKFCQEQNDTNERVEFIGTWSFSIPHWFNLLSLNLACDYRCWNVDFLDETSLRDGRWHQTQGFEPELSSLHSYFYPSEYENDAHHQFRQVHPHMPSCRSGRLPDRVLPRDEHGAGGHTPPWHDDAQISL